MLMGSLLYSLGADPTENNVTNNPCIVVMGGCLTIVLTYLPAVTKERMFLLVIVAYQRYYMT
jgi:hypothetical protein